MIQRGQLYLMNIFVCFALAIVVSMPVFAAPRIALTLPSGSQDIPLGEQLRLYGVPVAIRVFDVPLGLTALAQWLSDKHPNLTELSVMPGKIVLSGMLDGALCTVLMESQGAKRTAGSISILNASLKTPARTAAFAGMPSEARLRLDFSSIESGERVTQQVWSSSWPLERLRPVLHSGLRNTGWKTIQSTAHSELWQRGSSRLQVALMPTEEGTGVWSLQQDAL